MAVYVGDTFPAPLSDMEAAAVGGLSTTLISDALNRSGGMDCGIRPIGSSSAFVASALTVSVMVGDNRALHHAAAMVRPGYAIVVDGKHDMSTALWGEILHTMAVARGMRALVVDGCIRDSEALAATPMPVWARGRVPTGPHKGWGGAINIPIQCGGVAVMPGDILVGDNDGIVSIPRHLLNQATSEGRRLRLEERRLLDAIAQGQTTLELLELR
jgi:4-hydroxy-4-methyl-2-oxoglutarate aldolase